MIAHLQKGAFGEARILKAETAEQMHTTALTVLPRVDRMVLGFYEQNRNGRHIISHAGDTAWFHSDLYLFLDDNIGLFISLNSARQGGRGRQDPQGRVRAVYRSLSAGPDLRRQGRSANRSRARAHDDRACIRSRVASRPASSVCWDWPAPSKYLPNEDGTISVSMATNVAGTPIKWREVEPFVWRDVDGESFLSAQVTDGRVTRLAFEWVSPFMVFEPMPVDLTRLGHTGTGRGIDRVRCSDTLSHGLSPR